LPFDRDTALCLYAGILADTSSFRYSNTSPATHKAAAELLKYNLDVPFIYQSIYENIPFQDMRLLIRILPKIGRAAAGRIAWFQIKQKLLKNKKISFDLTDHVLSFGRAIKDVEVVALFKENLGVKNEIRINLRSQGKVDVNKIAAYFGGGGHKTASGATVCGKIEQVRRRVLAKIKESLK
jgi:phosphoesterase RecJ-like protein